MEPELFKDFCEEFTREANKARMAARVSIEAAEAEIKKIDRELDTLLDLILKGGAADRINAKMVALEQRKKDIAAMLETAEQPPLPFCIRTSPKFITNRSVLSTTSSTMRKRERSRPRGCARSSAASSWFPKARNWQSCCAAIWRRS
ncbi:hypothetical protein Q644_20830 [Brucella intermedia 229E]|uniref:Uncharacterized protein n=1 Tax=Brucella intermedia 229E TaxID=1337887 RepID=U4VFF8_9HYPH|nr:hypothetical protein Q644_20830 [Brucella intermedia 229E]